MDEEFFQIAVAAAAVTVACRDNIYVARRHYYILLLIEQNTAPVKHDIYTVKIVAVVLKPPFCANLCMINV